MKRHTTYKFRLYPNKEQQRKLIAWSDASRFIWNLANEQRVMALSRCRDQKLLISRAKQQGELTDLKKELPWLNDIPRHAADALLGRLDYAWQRYFKKVSGYPKWKKKNECISVTEVQSSKWSLCGNKLKFPKLGFVKAVVHREVQGSVGQCTIKRDVDQWYVFIQSEIEQDVTINGRPAVGIDRGLLSFTADSEGKLVKNPRFTENSVKLTVRAQRQMWRKTHCSNRNIRAKCRLSKAHQKTRFRRHDFLHKLSTQYSNSHGVVVLENLNVRGMLKSNCSGQVRDAGWGMFDLMLNYKLNMKGGTVVKVNAAYSSQTCSACGHVDSKSRVGELFSCTSCKHTEHADINAAKVILSRADRSVLPVEGDLKSQAQRSGKVKMSKLLKSSKRKIPPITTLL